MAEPLATQTAGSGSSRKRNSTADILTFLVSDLRGYTRFTAEQGNAAGARLTERFLDTGHTVVSLHGGEVFGSAGDQILAVFSSAADALEASLALQTRLEHDAEIHPDLPLIAGIGLDTGEAVRIGSDYRGHSVNRAARLCSIAGGGEIFASDTVVAVAHVMEGMALLDRGEVSLKGLPHPVRVLQIGREGDLPDSLPPLQPNVETHPTNLPYTVTPFIGRLNEVADITTLLQNPDVRLLTLVGPGGTGKTRLALEAAADLLSSFKDGVYFVDLSPLTDPALVATTIAETLGLKEEGKVSMLNAISEHLRDKRLLLVLDNWERVIEGAADVGNLLDSCGELQILATSRIPLHLSGEREYAVDPFGVPDPVNLPPTEQMEQYDGIAFFVERARAVKHGFALSDENAAVIASICSRLDGLPLAIELAAARVKIFPPQALLARLGSRLQLLTGGAKDRPDRHQTLRGAIDWSYSLLTGAEQTLLARVSVFSGGCSFEAVEEVCNPAGELDILEGLASLIDKTLLRQEGDVEPRLRMLETIREYADEKLGESGEKDAVRQAHATYFLALSQQAEVELTGSQQGEWLIRLDAEPDNLREAMSWCFSNGRYEEGLRIAVGTFEYWRSRGHWREAQGWLEKGLGGVNSIGPELQGKVSYLIATLLWLRNDLDESANGLEQALELADQAGDLRTRALVLNRLGGVRRSQGSVHAADRLLEESRQLAAKLGMTDLVAHATNNLGASAQNQGKWSTARQQYEEALALYDKLSMFGAASTTRANLGMVALGEGHFGEAETWFADALAAARQLGDKRRMVTALEGEGDVALHTGRLKDAARHFREALEVSRELGAKRDITQILLDLGEVARLEGRQGEARELLAEGLRLARDIGDVFAELWALGNMAVLAEAAGQTERAVRLKSAERTARDLTNVRSDSIISGTGDDLRARLLASLGDEAYSRAWEEGKELTLEDAVTYALEDSH